MLEAKILNLAITDKGFAIIMKTSKSKKVIPIFIAPLEAQSIMTGFIYLSQNRPLTHDLIKDIIDNCSIKVVHILIDSMQGDTFNAKIVLENNGKTILIDARPSDAIAISLRTKSPIFIEESVLDIAGILLDEAATNSSVKETLPFTYQSFDKNASDDVSNNMTNNDKEKKIDKLIDKLSAGSKTIENTTEEEIQRIKNELKLAVKEERYEDAARLRDIIDKLK